MKIFVLFAALVLGLSGQTPAPQPPGNPASAAQLPSLRHLVYQFGYNTKAADNGTGTGTMTIDIPGTGNDGGMIVKATDDWWNTVRPRETNTCEVYQNGNVMCSQPAFALSPIQAVLVPLLAQNYFGALSSNPNAAWTQAYTMHATFFPSATVGFAGQVYTWNCSDALTGKGVIPNGAPILLIQSNGTMTQKGGRDMTVNQKTNIAFDPRISMPVYLYQRIHVLPQRTVNDYFVELKLVKDSS